MSLMMLMSVMMGLSANAPGVTTTPRRDGTLTDEPPPPPDRVPEPTISTEDQHGTLIAQSAAFNAAEEKRHRRRLRNLRNTKVTP